MTELTIPEDTAAEEVVAAVCVRSAAGASLAIERLTAEDFYSPGCRRVFAAAALLPDSDEATRSAVAAAVAHVDDRWVAGILDRLPCALDSNGGHALRVFEASMRRRYMRGAADLHVAAASLWVPLTEVEALAKEVAACQAR